MFKWLRKRIRNYFGFSKTETNGVMILIPLMVVFLSAPTLYSRVFSSRYENYEADRALLDSVMLVWNKSVSFKEKENPKLPEGESIKIMLQTFDPNQASEATLQELGIPKFLVSRIINYRRSGGVFRIKNDLGKIYDFPDTLLAKLRPYISLPEQLPLKEFKTKISIPSKAPGSIKPRVEEPESIDINEADSLLFRTLQGIGPVYARRIIKYRNLLGGYTKIDQLSEVYGISDSLVQTFRARLNVTPNYEPKLIEINLATFKELNRHPYISYEQAGDILRAKSKNGKFKNGSDLSKVKSFDKSGIDRLLPYLSFK